MGKPLFAEVQPELTVRHVGIPVSGGDAALEQAEGVAEGHVESVKEQPDPPSVQPVDARLDVQATLIRNVYSAHVVVVVTHHCRARELLCAIHCAPHACAHAGGVVMRGEHVHRLLVHPADQTDLLLLGGRILVAEQMMLRSSSAERLTGGLREAHRFRHARSLHCADQMQTTLAQLQCQLDTSVEAIRVDGAVRILVVAAQVQDHLHGGLEHLQLLRHRLVLAAIRKHIQNVAGCAGDHIELDAVARRLRDHTHLEPDTAEGAHQCFVQAQLLPGYVHLARLLEQHVEVLLNLVKRRIALRVSARLLLQITHVQRTEDLHEAACTHASTNAPET
mmetsp:Transcript_14681/g.44081  ORF Transcript_14681/g.44081 Transcript_14681/m.44081 type:complete len:335 (-) Transcript_14681:1540-2544(-)